HFGDLGRAHLACQGGRLAERRRIRRVRTADGEVAEPERHDGRAQHGGDDANPGSHVSVSCKWKVDAEMLPGRGGFEFQSGKACFSSAEGGSRLCCSLFSSTEAHHLPTTTVATPLPMRFVSARASDMKRS